MHMSTTGYITEQGWNMESTPGTPAIRMECDICQKPCNTKRNLEKHLMTHVKRLKQGPRPKENKSVTVYYLGANSFGQINNLSSLVCWEPQILAENLSTISCNLSCVVWISAERQLHLCGLHEGKGGSSLAVKLPDNIEFSKIVFAFGSICGISEEGIFSLSPQNVWERIDNKVLKRLQHSKESVKQVVTCGKTVYCLTQRGRIFNLMEEDFCKMQVQIPGTVISFECGEEHCLAATEEKEVFAWGSSLKGQLGQGTLQEEPLPVRIPALGGLNIIQISCGKWHNVALTSEGDLYVWGWNKCGQLGLPCPDLEDLKSIESSITVQAEPILLDFQIGVRKIACGSAHTIVLADDFSIWGCGFAKFGQLGKQKNNEKVDKLVQVNFPKGKVTDIFARNWSSIIMIEK